MLAFLLAAAMAQVAQPTAAGRSAPETVQLRLTPPEVAVIADALLDKPMREAEPVMDDLRRQVNAQVRPRPEPAPPTPPAAARKP